MGKARAKQWQIARARQKNLTWIAFLVADSLFLVELVTGLVAGSASLQIDSLETGDTMAAGRPILENRFAPRQEAIVTLTGVGFISLICIWACFVVIQNLRYERLPNTTTMLAVGSVAIVANVAVLMLLRRVRAGSASLKAAWQCTRNSIFGNLAVIIAAIAIEVTHKSWPDALVAVTILPFALWRAVITVKSVLPQLRVTKPAHK
ncbi:MAG: cation transporter [Rhodospirillaceae bacterium]